MKNYTYLLPIVWCFLAFSFTIEAKNVNGFLKRNGQKISNNSTDNFLLKGVGPGGWMLQEGYMFKTPVGPQHQIKAMLQDLTDKEFTASFYDSWLQNFFTSTDVKLIHDWGFNSIRVPIHYNLFTLPIEDEPIPGKNTWLTNGFNMLDELVQWCELHDIYLIIDLHAAPGGQGKDANISDYNPAKPSLWESKANQDKTVALWYRIANRYKNKAHIGGYDLINEPNWAFNNDGKNKNGCDCTKNIDLLNLYKRITDTIRTVDKQHIIFVEGNCWANNYKGLQSLASYDDNLVFSFHKYWSNNDDESIKETLQLREQLNVPLYLGETGENSNTWFTDMVTQMNRLNIGWSSWAFKQMDIDDPYTIVSKSWETIINYNPKTGENKPTREEAMMAMNDLLENIKTNNCKLNKDVIFAYIEAPESNERRAFKTHNIPGTIFAVDYDLGTFNHAWYDKDYQDLHVSNRKYTAWNSGYTYRSDGVDITSCNDPITNGYCVSWTEDGEWTAYTLADITPGNYRVIVRVSGVKGKINLTLGDQKYESEFAQNKSDKSKDPWYDLVINNVALTNTNKDLKVIFSEGGLDINYIKFELLPDEAQKQKP